MTTTKQRDAALDAIKTAKTLTATDAARMVCDVANRLDYADGTDDWSGLGCLAAAIETQSRATAFAYASTFETGHRERIPMAVWAWLGGELIHAK